MSQIKEHDIISLTTSVEGIPEGTRGTVVHVYNEKIFEVEFSESKVITLSIKEIKLIA